MQTEAQRVWAEQEKKEAEANARVNPWKILDAYDTEQDPTLVVRKDVGRATSYEFVKRSSIQERPDHENHRHLSSVATTWFYEGRPMLFWQVCSKLEALAKEKGGLFAGVVIHKFFEVVSTNVLESTPANNGFIWGSAFRIERNLYPVFSTGKAVTPAP